MSYSDYLDWLARNVHKWPESILDGTFRKEIIWIEPNREMKAAMVDNPLHCYSKPQWLARRAELQNKPSWKDAPEWAEWLSQDEGGAWWFFRCRPEAKSVVWDCDDSAYHHSSWIDGEVLGDWRDTLERRPADMYKTTPEIDTSAERVQKTPESVRNWHESGELPPVGVFVDVTGDVAYGEGEKGCEVIAHVENCAVIRMSWGLGCFVSRALSPHRTEKDDAVEAMKALCPYPGSWETTYRLFAEALYDAGYRAGGFE